MDKRSNQISLPLHVPANEMKDIVKQHWNITFSKQGRISVVGKKIMAMVMRQINENDMRLKPYYQMSASDVVKAGDKGGSAYKLCKAAFKELSESVWMIEDIENQYFEPRNILDTTKTDKRDGFKTAYNKGEITIAINPALEPYFINMAHYSTFELEHYMHFKSWYSMRIWELLSAWKDKPFYRVSVEEYKILMDCEGKYIDKRTGRTNIAMLLDATLSEPLKELAPTDLAFRVEKVYGREYGVNKPVVQALELHFLNATETPIQKIERWKKGNERQKFLIERAINVWKIEPVNLAKHLPIIEVEPFALLIKSFELKQISSEKMKDIKNYCNAAIFKLSKKIKAAKKDTLKQHNAFSSDIDLVSKATGETVGKL